MDILGFWTAPACSAEWIRVKGLRPFAPDKRYGRVPRQRG
jgi:hypothetical protein